MSERIELPVELRFWDADPRPGVAVVRERTVPERILRSLTALGIAWGLSLVSILIPVAHFVLVPGFALGGLVFAFHRFQESKTLVSVQGHCPRCQQQQTFLAGFRFNPPAKIDCPGCRNEIEVECK